MMNIKIHWISKKLVELSVDEISTGTLNSVEAKDLASKLLAAASELLEVSDKS
jgi:hypothetical protein